MKAFLSMLSLVPLSFMIAVAPILSTLGHHISVCYSLSRNDPWANKIWWDWFGSWIFFGGPLGRWVAGMLLGFYIQQSKPGYDDPRFPGDIIDKPHLNVVALVGMVLLVSCFTVVCQYGFSHLLSLFIS